MVEGFVVPYDQDATSSTKALTAFFEIRDNLAKMKQKIKIINLKVL